MLSTVLFVGLSVYVGYTSKGLSIEASKGEDEFIYDINNVVSYYVESLSNQNTLIYSHSIQKTSPDVVVTCLDCHDIEKLKQLYSTCNPDILDEINSAMSNSVKEICFVCHGSYTELIDLTQSYEGFQDLKGTIFNPHDTMLGEAECYVCHSLHEVMDPVITGLNFCYKCHPNKVLSLE